MKKLIRYELILSIVFSFSLFFNIMNYEEDYVLKIPGYATPTTIHQLENQYEQKNSSKSSQSSMIFSLILNSFNFIISVIFFLFAFRRFIETKTSIEEKENFNNYIDIVNREKAAVNSNTKAFIQELKTIGNLKPIIRIKKEEIAIKKYKKVEV